MIVTGAFLAESASSVANKLEVHGGVVDKFVANADRVARVTLVVLTQPQPFDKSPGIELTIRNPRGEMERLMLEVPQSSLGGRVGFVCAPLRIPVPTDGDYSLSASAERGSITLPLTVLG